jgi:hypothetical protein
LILGGLLVLTVAGLVGHGAWPKYGLCLESSRYDEIACLARRNLHFSAHLTWSFNRRTVEAVMAEVGAADIPVLVELLGDERAVLRGLAGSILPELGEAGLAALQRAAQSPDPVMRRTAETALMDYEIIRSSTQGQD